MVLLNDHQADNEKRGSKNRLWDLGLDRVGSWLGSSDERLWLNHYPAGVPHHLAYPQQQLGWLLQQAAERFPTRIACCYYHETLTYQELLSRSQRLAAVLAREGLQPGNRVGVLLPNLPETIIALFATWMAGGVVVSLSPLMVAEEVDALIKSTNCRVVVTLDVLSPLVCHQEHPPELAVITSLSGRLSRLEQLGYAWVRFQKIGFRSACPMTRVVQFDEAVKGVGNDIELTSGQADQVAFVLPTGGTTGHPKAVMLSHQNLISQAWQLAHWSRGHHGEESILAVLPFFHSYGLSTSVMMGLALGATLVIHHRFRPLSAVRLIEKHRPTMFLAVPAMLSAINTKVLRSGSYDLSSLHSVISGGAALSPAIAEEFETHSGATVVEGYGLSEASPVTHVGPLDGTAVPGTIGFPLPDTDARIVNSIDGSKTMPVDTVGELVVRGPQVMLGYWDDSEATNNVIQNGWLHTGDLASCDGHGVFKIVDRMKDLIITSGFNVYPGDVESVLRTYPGVRDAAVVGVPDEDRGEIVKAVLVIESPQKFHRREFDEFTQKHLAAQKRPRIVEVREDDLPRNFLGKVLRRALREPQESDSGLHQTTEDV